MRVVSRVWHGARRFCRVSVFFDPLDFDKKMLECYICHEMIESWEYTRHVASHLAGNVTGADPRSNPILPVFSNNSFGYEHPGTARSTPPRLTVHAPRQETSKGRSKPLNAFQLWFENYAPSRPKYTTIDGERSNPDTEVREGAELLRGTTREEIVKIVKGFKGFGSNDARGTCLELVQKAPIFPGLVGYVYTHLILCPARGWLSNDDWSDQVSELKRLVASWAKYEDAWCILSCDKIKDDLLKILRVTRVEPAAHRCNLALLNGTTALKHDILNLAALAVLCITGPRKQDVLGKPGGQVRKLIELFSDLLESNVELEECYRRRFLNVLIPFSKESGCCPERFYIPEGVINDLKWESGGGFGQVSKGKLDTRLVAVKALKRNKTNLSDYTKLLSEEAIVWWYLRHPNCLPLYGIYIVPEDGPSMHIGLVSPWMAQGTLSDYLKHNSSASRTQLILDVTRGLTYLHTMEPHVAHQDIKPANILITSKGRACLADFGLASVFDTADDLHLSAGKVDMGGTPHYMAPEIFIAGSRAEKRQVNKRACDMYALGCTIYEVYAGRPPFAETSPAIIEAKVVSGLRPEFPVDKISPDMWSFVENLWDSEPLKRLTAEKALDWMEEKASREGVDLSPAPLDEEWERKREARNNLWSVSI